MSSRACRTSDYTNIRWERSLSAFFVFSPNQAFWNLQSGSLSMCLHFLPTGILKSALQGQQFLFSTFLVASMPECALHGGGSFCFDCFGNKCAGMYPPGANILIVQLFCNMSFVAPICFNQFVEFRKIKEFSVFAITCFLTKNRPQDQGESIENQNCVVGAPNESSNGVMGASLVTKHAGRVPQHD